jgi:hypothetical protein
MKSLTSVAGAGGVVTVAESVTGSVSETVDDTACEAAAAAAENGLMNPLSSSGAEDDDSGSGDDDESGVVAEEGVPPGEDDDDDVDDRESGPGPFSCLACGIGSPASGEVVGESCSASPLLPLPVLLLPGCCAGAASWTCRSLMSDALNMT